MEKLLNNLYLYEIVMLILGIFLFVLLCGGLVYYIIKKDDIKKLLYFFVIPIIMIGYPSIQEIQIEKDKFALKKYTDRVLDDPEDEEAQKELQRIARNLEKRAKTTEDLKVLSEANLVLGNTDRVIDLTTKAIEKQEETTEDREQEEAPADSHDRPSSEKTNETQKQIASLKELQQLATFQKKWEGNPTLVKDSARLQQHFQRIEWNNPKIKAYYNKKMNKETHKP